MDLPFSVPSPIARQAAAAEFWLELNGRKEGLENEVKTASVKEAFLKEAMTTEAKRKLVGATVGATGLGVAGAARAYKSSTPDASGTSPGERSAQRDFDALKRELDETGGGSKLQRLKLQARAQKIQGEKKSRENPRMAALVSGATQGVVGGIVGHAAGPKVLQTAENLAARTGHIKELAKDLLSRRGK